MKSRIVAFMVALSGVALGADAPWTSEADVGVTVSGHSFHHAKVEGNGCTVSVKVLFDAPEKDYSDPKNVVRNYHRFRARVRLAKGQSSRARSSATRAPANAPIRSRTTPPLPPAGRRTPASW
jgi:hypothetical protein